MADVSLGVTTSPFIASGFFSSGRAQVAVDKNNVYAFVVDSNDDFEYVKSTNGGTSFGSAVSLDTGTVRSAAIWYDGWGETDTGTKIYLAWQEDGTNDLNFNALDTADDTLDGEVKIDNSLAPNSNQLFTEHCTSIVKAEGGNLYVVARPDDVGGTPLFYRSTDGGLNWTSRSTTGLFDGNTDNIILLPDQTAADSNDIQALYFDRTNGEITLKKYDNSANTWSEGSAVVSGMTSMNADYIHASAAVRHSDGDVLAAVWTESFTATGDLKCVNLTDGTTLTDVLTNTAYRGITDIFIDQNTDDIYVGYLEDQTGGNHMPHYKKSTDGGTTWGSATSLGDGSGADDYKDLSMGYSTPGAADGIMCGVWFDEDDSLGYFGVDGKVEITAAAGATTRRYSLPLLGVG